MPIDVIPSRKSGNNNGGGGDGGGGCTIIPHKILSKALYIERDGATV